MLAFGTLQHQGAVGQVLIELVQGLLEALLVEVGHAALLLEQLLVHHFVEVRRRNLQGLRELGHVFARLAQQFQGRVGRAQHFGVLEHGGGAQPVFGFEAVVADAGER